MRKTFLLLSLMTLFHGLSAQEAEERNTPLTRVDKLFIEKMNGADARDLYKGMTVSERRAARRLAAGDSKGATWHTQPKSGE